MLFAFSGARIVGRVGGGRRGFPSTVAGLDPAEVLARSHVDSERCIAAAITPVLRVARLIIATAIATRARVVALAARIADGRTWTRAGAYRLAWHALRRHDLWANHLRTYDLRLDDLLLVDGRSGDDLRRRDDRLRRRSAKRPQQWRPRTTTERAGAYGAANPSTASATGEASRINGDSEQQGDTFHLANSLPGGWPQGQGGGANRSLVSSGGTWALAHRQAIRGGNRGGAQCMRPIVRAVERGPSVASWKPTSHSARCKCNR
jgi:hypothetical protein